jgi:2-succinyl-5-enolpyruvyl-6-hydroxy-3-cyclohexene-1-carboxylate synthase
MITEKHITMLAKMIKMRDTCRKIYGNEWKAKQDQWRPIIQAAMREQKCNELEAGIHLSKTLEANGQDIGIMIVWGTIMEMQES